MQKVEKQKAELQQLQQVENATDVVVLHLWQAAPRYRSLALGSPQLPPPPAGTTVLWPIPHPAHHQQPADGTHDCHFPGEIAVWLLLKATASKLARLRM